MRSKRRVLSICRYTGTRIVRRGAYDRERYVARKGDPEYQRIHRIASALHLARQRGFEVVDEDIDPEVVYERDKWICQLCGNPVDKTLPHLDPMSASLDHTAPIHSWVTVQLAHRLCNHQAGSLKELT